MDLNFPFRWNGKFYKEEKNNISLLFKAGIEIQFFYNKTAFFAGQNAKTRHKNTPSMADKHPRIYGKALHRPGSAPLPHSGLRGAYTRVLSGYPSLFGQKKSLS